jgi:uncharacterized protein
MRTSDEFPFRVTEEPDLGIVLSDGCRLSARVWMPEDALLTPVPAILEYIPYRKRDGTLPRDELMHPYFAGHGYAAVRVDMRGNGDSDGVMEDEYTPLELSDACEVIDWLSRQPWCSGPVGMMGKSWGGFNCLQTAFLRPPALKAVVSVMSTTDRFADDIHFKGGCLMGENLGWGATMLSYSSRPPDPALRADWREVWLERLAADDFLAPRWAGRQTRDAYWKHGSVCEDWAAIEVPVLSVGGWADGYMNTVSHLVSNLKVPVQGIVGPWVHQYPHTAVPGPQAGFLQLALRWWDRWLKDIPNGAEADPAYRAYMIDSHPPDASAPSRPGRWLAEAIWPSSHVATVTMPLSSGGRLGGAGGSVERAISTPQHLGLCAGEYFPMGLNAEMPGDQREDDALSVTFETEPMPQGIELMGAAVLRATVSSDRPLAFLVARLCDVALDGASSRIAHGMLNLCHRDSRENPTPLAPGKAVDITLTLDQMAWRLAPGHRLRLALSTTYFPFLWPSPEAAEVTLHKGVLDLPVHDGSHTAYSMPEPEVAPPWRHRVLRKGAAARRIERDLRSGRQSLIVEDDSGDSENLTHGLITGETVRERWTVHPGDPLSAEAEITWEQRLSRGDWSVRTLARSRMTASATDLHLTAELVAWEGTAEVFRRVWDEKVPREVI